MDDSFEFRLGNIVVNIIEMGVTFCWSKYILFKTLLNKNISNFFYLKMILLANVNNNRYIKF